MSEIEEDFKELMHRLQLGVYVPKSVIMTEDQLNRYENVFIELEKENEQLKRENDELKTKIEALESALIKMAEANSNWSMAMDDKTVEDISHLIVQAHTA